MFLFSCSLNTFGDKSTSPDENDDCKILLEDQVEVIIFKLMPIKLAHSTLMIK